MDKLSAPNMPQPTIWGWLPVVALISAVGVFVTAYAFNLSQMNGTGLPLFYFLALPLIAAPTIIRLISPTVSRFERLGLLYLFGCCLYLVKVMSSPLHFSLHDELQHWYTAQEIARTGHLFGRNLLLPVSSYYPGLEIVTNALHMLSGLDLFPAGLMVIGIAHLVMILSLFFIYERITKSPRVASIATLIYMFNYNFLLFDASFIYESLALPLAVFILFALVTDSSGVLIWITLGALVFTHHLTSFIFVGILLAWGILERIRHRTGLLRLVLLRTAVIVLLLSLVVSINPGNPVVAYLTTYFARAFTQLRNFLTSVHSGTGLPFSTSGSQLAPIWERGMAVAALALAVLCIPFGFFRIRQRYYSHTLAILLGLLALLYPIVQLFRFTSRAIGLAQRAEEFLFISIALLIALCIAHFFPTQILNWQRKTLLTCVLVFLLIGKACLGTSFDTELPGPYLVAAGPRSIEGVGIETAMWAGSHLKPNSRIATDQSNLLLIGDYGHQHLVISSGNYFIFSSLHLERLELSLLRQGRIRYLVVDLRLARSLPSVGFYYARGESGALHHTTPIPLKALTKFGTLPQVNTIYDGGDMLIYDVGGLLDGPQKS